MSSLITSGDIWKRFRKGWVRVPIPALNTFGRNLFIVILCIGSLCACTCVRAVRAVKNDHYFGLQLNSQDGVEFATEEIMQVDEIIYKRQKYERHEELKWLSQYFSHIGANWPCHWNTKIIGYNSSQDDGWKFTCGVDFIQNPCVIYSLGSNGNFGFEIGINHILPNCEIHIFDLDAFKLPTESFKNPSSVQIHWLKIASQTNLFSDPQEKSLEDIMKSFEHVHLDILKMDIEGTELAIIDKDSFFPSVGQLLAEFHGRLTAKDLATNWTEAVESFGLRLFHKELNVISSSACIELAFIQHNWNPSIKNYN